MRTTRSALTALFALAATCLAADQPWREFKSADGSQTFVGQLLGFRKTDETATVRLKTTMQTANVPLAKLSQADQAYIKEQAASLTPAATVELEFEKIMDLADSERDSKTRTKTYRAGYKINVRSYSPDALENVEVDYLIIYRKDEVNGLGERVVHPGSKQFGSVPANATELVDATDVELENYFKEGEVTRTRTNNNNNNNNNNANVHVSRPEKRRDVLLGCVAQVKVGGKVVLVDGTSTDLLREYGDKIGSARAEPAPKPKAKGK